MCEQGLGWGQGVLTMKHISSLVLFKYPERFKLNYQRSKCVNSKSITYECPCSSNAVPLLPPISQTMIDWSKLPENRSFLFLSQHKLLTLPVVNTNQSKLYKISAKSKLIFLEEVHSSISQRYLQTNLQRYIKHLRQFIMKRKICIYCVQTLCLLFT